MGGWTGSSRECARRGKKRTAEDQELVPKIVCLTRGQGDDKRPAKMNKEMLAE